MMIQIGTSRATFEKRAPEETDMKISVIFLIEKNDPEDKERPTIKNK